MCIDVSKLLDWHRHTGNPKTTFLVHGEKDSMAAFSHLLKNTRVEMPALHQEFEL